MEKNKFALTAAWLFTHELLLVAGLTALSLADSRWLPVTVIGGLLFWPLRRWRVGYWSVRTPADWPVAILAGLALVNLVVTPVIALTGPQVERLLAGIVLYYAVVNWILRDTSDHGGRLRQAASLFMLVGLVLAAAALFFVDWDPHKAPWLLPGFYERLSGLAASAAFDRINPNVMAGSLVIILPVALGWRLFSPGGSPGWFTWFANLAILAMSGVILLSQSRGAWLACGSSVLVITALRWRKGWQASALVVALVIAAGIWFGLESSLQTLFENPGLNGLDGRLEVWRRAAALIQDFPFTGVGLGVFQYTVDRFYPFYSFPPGSVEHAHNLFLQIGVDLGLPGLLAWLAAWVVIFRAARLAYKRLSARQVQSWQTGLAVGLVASQTALVVHGLVDAVTWGMVRPAPIIWYGWGMSVALAAIASRVSSDSD